MADLLCPPRRKTQRIRVLICTFGMAAGPLLGDVKIQVREGLPIVDGVYVDGHGPYRFLVDTGTNVNLMDARLAQSIGLTGTFQSELLSATGVMVAPGSGGIEVALGSVTADEQKFLFMRLEAIHHHWPDIQGVLGQYFLSRFDYVLDLRRGRLEFRKQERIGTRARLATMNGRPMVTTSLGELVLDSGALRIVLFGVQPEVGGTKRELRTVTGSQQIGMVFNRPLIIEGRTFWRGDAVAMPNAAELGVGGLLPLNLFKAIYVCNSEGYVVFE